MMTIYHNARCSKSRKGVAYLENLGVDFRIRNYLNEPFTAEELKALIAKTGLKVAAVIRSEEDFFKSNLKGKNMSDDELIAVMIAEPRLIQRPIVEKDGKAVLARPVENISQLL